MLKARIGLVAVASNDESGGQRAEGLVLETAAKLSESGLDVICGKKIIWTPADSIEVCDDLYGQRIDALVILHSTWVLDSLSYLLVNKLRVPVVLWAVPYTETFSFACVQHMVAVLKSRGLPHEMLYGLPQDDELMARIGKIAMGARLCRVARNMNIALLGPRQTWRVAGPQDMSHEEWEFSEKFGTTIVHLEMDEVLNKVAAISDEEAQATLDQLASRTGKVMCDPKDMIFAAKVYTSIKEVMQENNLDAVAAECYPKFDGITNLTASWLADEGIVVETEGDISHVMLKEMLNCSPGEGVTLLGEIGSFDKDRNVFFISHGGSSGHFTADSVDRVRIFHSGDTGTYVGVPVKEMPVVTVANITGQKGQYRMLISKGRTLPVSDQEWEAAGGRLLVKLSFDKPVDEVLNQLLANGVDHHLIIREGDYTEELSLFCDFLGVEKVIL